MRLSKHCKIKVHAYLDHNVFKNLLEVNSYLMHLLLNDFIYFDDYYDGTIIKPKVLEDSLCKGNLP